jgi:hypothetical protein
MALQRKGENWDFGTVGVTCAGIVEVTGFTCRREYATQIEGAKADGEIGALLYGKEKYTIEIEGYAATGDLPEIGGAIELKGISGVVMGIEIVGSNEDFTKCRVSGLGYPDVGMT